MTSAMAVLQAEAKSKNARMFEMSAHVKGAQAAKIIPWEPSTVAHLVAQLRLQRVTS